ncbi:rhomboid family intramembrane serine protease [Rhizobium sp. TH2]|uniref:rhomboid family intramembrane serine protease n=1 Tax=Rhizobium sp. TH2 TaxID=2775403 RepID=UPI0021588501|nr:rhomboid family intramembrane serine protease [Rhizobium sp. TH2]UVC11129.1 rhomboid family intramembrane serine protease [Rhizobium sp. TH2]
MTLEENRGPEPANDWSPPREPIFNIPAVLIVLVALMFAIHLVRTYLLTTEQDQTVIYHAAFISARYLHPLSEQDYLGYFGGPVTYSLLHGGWLHLIFNCIWLVAFATPLAVRIGAFRFVALWIVSAVASAFFQGVLTGFEMSVLIGASGVVSATVGAVCRFALPLSGTRQMRSAAYAPRLGPLEALTYRSVISFIVVWALSNILLVGVLSGASNIAWQAHLGGFLFGYFAFAIFDPPLRR